MLKFGGALEGRLAEASWKNHGSAKACRWWKANAALSLCLIMRFAKTALARLGRPIHENLAPCVLRG